MSCNTSPCFIYLLELYLLFLSLDWSGILVNNAGEIFLYWSIIGQFLSVHTDSQTCTLCTVLGIDRCRVPFLFFFHLLHHFRPWTLPWSPLWHGQCFWEVSHWLSQSTCVTSDSSVKTNSNKLEILDSMMQVFELNDCDFNFESITWHYV